MKAFRPLLYAVLAIGLMCRPAWADHWHDDHGHGDHKSGDHKNGDHKNGDEHAKPHADRHGDSDRDADVCWFQPHDVQVITGYYAPHYQALPPGLAKKYYRTGHLPPGWQKKIQPLPVAVERQLVPLPPDYRRGVIDGYAVVYNPRTQVMIDVVAVFGR